MTHHTTLTTFTTMLAKLGAKSIIAEKTALVGSGHLAAIATGLWYSGSYLNLLY